MNQDGCDSDSKRRNGIHINDICTAVQKNWDPTKLFPRKTIYGKHYYFKSPETAVVLKGPSGAKNHHEEVSLECGK